MNNPLLERWQWWRWRQRRRRRWRRSEGNASHIGFRFFDRLGKPNAFLVGENIRLRCSVKVPEFTIHSISWNLPDRGEVENNNNNNNNNNNSRVHVSKSDVVALADPSSDRRMEIGSSEVTLNSAILKDEGIYGCTVTYPLLPVCQQKTRGHEITRKK